MGNPRGFIEVQQKLSGNRPVNERIDDYGEVEQTLNDQDRKLQASRCMDCGVPFCHWGCPVGSKIPEWQDALYRGDYKLASEVLHSTNSFPEFTGRVCPAPCEKSCVLAIHEEAVTIRENEASTVEKAFELGLIQPRIPKKRTGKKVAVIGSGPSGLSVADQLNQKGHTVTVFERDDAIGGLLRYGIPDFKLNKKVIDRRQRIFEKEGIEFRINTAVGVDVKGEELLQEFDAVVLAIGAMQPRDLPVEGRDLKGIHFAMDYLKQQNKVNRGTSFSEDERINAKGKKVMVIGGGDTGSDCVGTANRQRAEKVMQIEIMPKPPASRTPDNPWPFWPNVLKVSSSHQEGCERMWSLSTRRFIGEKGQLKAVEVVEVEWMQDNGRWKMEEKEDTVRKIEVDMVMLSMGFVHPVHKGLVEELGLELDQRGNVKIDECFGASKPGVFAAGDAASGASLVVTAIAKGREAAAHVHEFLSK
ncbi:glutamate synthase subunit beta [Marinilabilia salmonicolor]|jgi:glutamate synthase (NADPH/NADH) small chain|uniref:Glutamate synthase (NADPH/NADH) small chain n=1 Tax=Marinilabilia salmonicolor TaxID=989 RepID=A0A2T0XT18_9BACT|nr:glutamate synthase subunit beta [Marinilabilia salmonicolor]PRZ02089.1 glutamate synthase (NADPH/NADH) small chain [Marinilabilia salmonicolor]RCW36044.1 glutamate synthase (NADPH/NADH) small chain [Marinilabilia salmonicolor]